MCMQVSDEVPLSDACSDGTLLARLVAALKRSGPLHGIETNPRATAARIHNISTASSVGLFHGWLTLVVNYHIVLWQQVLAVLRNQPSVAPDHLFCEHAIVCRADGVAEGML